MNIHNSQKEIKLKDIIPTDFTSKDFTYKDFTYRDFIPKEFMNRNNTIYKIDCQCLCEIENQISEIQNNYQTNTKTYQDVKILDKNFEKFQIQDCVYTITGFKTNRNIKQVLINEDIIENWNNTSLVSSSDSSNLDNINSDASLIQLSSLSLFDESETSQSVNITQNETSQLESSQNKSLDISTTSDISLSLSDHSHSSIENEKIIDLIVNDSNKNRLSDKTHLSNQKRLSNKTHLSNQKHLSDKTHLSDKKYLSDKCISDRCIFDRYIIQTKTFQGKSFKIIVYSIYQNDYLIKCFTLFNHVILFRYFYKEPYLYDVFQSVVGHYDYLNSLNLEKNKLYYFYKINNLQNYVLKIYVYQLNQGKWQSWNAEMNIILGLDLSRPFYIIQFLQNINNKYEKLFIDLLNKFDTTLKEKTLFVQNVFGDEFQYLQHSSTFDNNDQGVLIDVQGSTRQMLW